MVKFNKKYSFLLKISLIVFVAFLIVMAVMWIYFRSTARNIGYYLATGKRSMAVILITEYLGNPPSKIKAKILSNFYNLGFEYYDNGVLKWHTSNKLEFNMRMYHGRKSMMGNGPFENMNRMMRGMFKKDVYLGDGKLLSIYFPIYPHKKVFIFPVLFIIVAILFIASIIFFVIKRTLMPIQKLIEASHRIGNGDLSYRMTYLKNDEFSNVVNAFNIMAEKLEGMLKSQRELLHMISHELRTPLTRINLALELGNFEESKEIIKSEVKGINELIESIMELSRLDNEEVATEKSELVSIIEKIIKRYKNKKNNFRKKILINYAPVRGKGILLEKAIGNIIDNAVKYSDNSEPIDIEFYKDNNYYVCRVSNSGKGLDKDEIKNVFKPFYRAKNAIISSKDGKGLGLVVANRIIEGIGGSINCESSPEGPTKFTISIPVYE